MTKFILALVIGFTAWAEDKGLVAELKEKPPKKESHESEPVQKPYADIELKDTNSFNEQQIINHIDGAKKHLMLLKSYLKWVKKWVKEQIKKGKFEKASKDLIISFNLIRESLTFLEGSSREWRKSLTILEDEFTKRAREDLIFLEKNLKNLKKDVMEILSLLHQN